MDLKQALHILRILARSLFAIDAKLIRIRITTGCGLDEEGTEESPQVYATPCVIDKENNSSFIPLDRWKERQYGSISSSEIDSKGHLFNSYCSPDFTGSGDTIEEALQVMIWRCWTECQSRTKDWDTLFPKEPIPTHWSKE